jgi:hypothetical protein
VRASDLCVIVVLCDDGHAMLDRRSRDERIGELDSAVDPRSEAIGNESRPRSHYSLGDRYRICTPSQCEGVGTSGTCRVIRRIQHAELELADGDYGYRYAFGQFTKGTSCLASNED